jgi:poly(3-hydroxybutyrate) depolymerase
MKKLLYALMVTSGIMAGQKAIAQCPAGRYNTELFTDYTVTTVTYSTPHNLQMDIYQPTGDTYTNRPVMLLAHGGSFISGNKTADGTVVEMCKRFAKRGYVAASINYRLGDLFSIADSNKAIAIVVKAISDGKAAIRYFVKDAATTNTYKIDTNNIFIGGNSAGAVLFMHAAYLNTFAEVPSYIADTMVTNGGFDGNSGNDGYSLKIRAVVNLAGALNKASFVESGNVPSVNVQGTDDVTVPYNCGKPMSGVVPVTLCGLGQLEPEYVSKGIYHWSKIYTGEGHVPWNGNTAMLNSVDSMVRDFCYSLMCTTGIQENASVAGVSLYPNPAGTATSLSSEAAMGVIAIADYTGRIVRQYTPANKNSVTINTSDLLPGMYIVRIAFADINMAPVVKQLTIQ